MAGQVIHHIVLKPVSRADLHCFQPVEHINLSKRNASHTADRAALPHNHSIKPAHAPLASCDCAELVPALAQQLPDFIIELSRERSRADPRRIGFHDTQHEAGTARPKP